MKKILFTIALAVGFISCKSTDKAEQHTNAEPIPVNQLDETKPFKKGNLSKGIYALMSTTKGDMLIQLYADRAPMTVGNFVALAEGKQKECTVKEGPFYDGLTFHRVIKGFMIQGGDYTGTGAGDAGYRFADEFHEDLKHDSKGILSMANAGPKTNGTQFFITDGPTPHLDNRHSVFGKVIHGLKVIDAITSVEKGASDKPKEPIVINSVEIIRKGSKYKKIKGYKAFEEWKLKALEEERLAKEKAEKELKDCRTVLDKIEPKATETTSGLKYFIHSEGNGTVAKEGETVFVHYDLKLRDCKIIDSSFKRNNPIRVQVKKGQVIPGWDEALTTLKRGTKATLIIPAKLAYGERGAGGLIPPNATLYFDIHILDKQ